MIGLLTDPVATFELSESQFFRVRKMLLHFEGEMLSQDYFEDGDAAVLSETWNCGVTLTSTKAAGEYLAGAYDTYAKHFLVQALAHIELTPAPPPLEWSAENLEGAYVLMGLGVGDPEECRFFGPINEHVLRLLEHPKVVVDLATVLAHFTAFTPAFTGEESKARLVVAVRNIKYMLTGSAPRPLSQLLAEAADEELLSFGNALLAALAADETSLFSESERAAAKTYALAMRCRLAQGLIVLGLA